MHIARTRMYVYTVGEVIRWADRQPLYIEMFGKNARSTWSGPPLLAQLGQLGSPSSDGAADDDLQPWAVTLQRVIPPGPAILPLGPRCRNPSSPHSKPFMQPFRGPVMGPQGPEPVRFAALTGACHVAPY